MYVLISQGFDLADVIPLNDVLNSEIGQRQKVGDKGDGEPLQEAMRRIVFFDSPIFEGEDHQGENFFLFGHWVVWVKPPFDLV